MLSVALPRAAPLQECRSPSYRRETGADLGAAAVPAGGRAGTWDSERLLWPPGPGLPSLQWKTPACLSHVCVSSEVA